MEKDSQTAKARAVSRHIGIIHLFMASSSTNKYTPWRAVCLGGVG
jgi:hypothetical protein